MSASVLAPAVPLSAFTLGCAVLHAARAHAASLTPFLAGMAVAAAVLVLLGASMAPVPDDPTRLDDITVYSAA
jgi:hypothetical protein